MVPDFSAMALLLSFQRTACTGGHLKSAVSFPHLQLRQRDRMPSKLIGTNAALSRFFQSLLELLQSDVYLPQCLGREGVSVGRAVCVAHASTLKVAGAAREGPLMSPDRSRICGRSQPLTHRPKAKHTLVKVAPPQLPSDSLQTAESRICWVLNE